MSKMKRLFRKILKMYTDDSAETVYKSWQWVFRYIAQYKREMAVYIVFGIVSVWMSLASAVASKWLVDAVSSYNAKAVVPAVVWMIVLALLGIVFQCVASRVSVRIQIKVNNDIQKDIYEKILHVKWLELSGFHSGDLLNRFHSDTIVVAECVSGLVPNIVIKTVSFVSSFAVIIFYDYTMAFIALLSAPVMLFASKLLMRKLQEHNAKMKEIASETTAFGVETFRNVESIKSFSLTDIFVKKLLRLQEKYKAETVTYNHFSTKMTMYLSFVGLGVHYACFGWGAFRLFMRKISYGTLTLFLQQATVLSSTFQAIVNIIPSTVSAMTSAKRIMEVVSLEKEEEFAPEVLGRPDVVKMDQAAFGYREGHTVLDHVCMEANKGEVVCIVGASGEGKTTLLRALLGLLQPSEGKAYLEENGQKVMLGSRTRRYFAYVPQENTLFSGTIEDNLKLVAPEATEAEMQEALRVACADEFVFKLPQGLQTMVVEKNGGLSMGQSQRIMLARAVLAKAPILLLDEATSALDMVTERNIMRNLAKNKDGKICIVTTHRPNVLYMADKVYRVEEGNVTMMTEEEIENYRNEF